MVLSFLESLLSARTGRYCGECHLGGSQGKPVRQSYKNSLTGFKILRIDHDIQPNMVSGVYLKTWTGTVNGSPPTGGGGGGGFVKNVTARRVTLSGVDRPVHLYQTNGGHS